MDFAPRPIQLLLFLKRTQEKFDTFIKPCGIFRRISNLLFSCFILKKIFASREPSTFIIKGDKMWSRAILFIWYDELNQTHVIISIHSYPPSHSIHLCPRELPLLSPSVPRMNGKQNALLLPSYDYHVPRMFSRFLLREDHKRKLFHHCQNCHQGFESNCLANGLFLPLSINLWLVCWTGSTIKNVMIF